MNRTQALMATVAAAVALSGKTPQGVTEQTPQVRGEQTQTTAGQTIALTASQAADAVLPKVDVSQSKALSLEDLRRLLPNLDAKSIQAGLDRLIYDGKVKRLGEGTEKEPYSYYRYQGGHG